jgi:hypothetical protein
MYDKKSNVVRGGFTAAQIKNARTAIRHRSGVPIRNVVLLWTIGNPVVVSRWDLDHASGKRRKIYDAETDTGDRRAARVYIGGSNHHIEIREDSKRRFKGNIVSSFVVGQRLLTQLRKLRELERPLMNLRRPLTHDERRALTAEARASLARQRRNNWKEGMRALRSQRAAIIAEHPIVDRRNNDEGEFVMSLCEGETLLMKHKHTGEVSYFVVAELNKEKRQVVLVPHWDARRATERKDANGKKIPRSKRDEFNATLADLRTLGAPGYRHAVKVRVSPLGDWRPLERD